MQYDKQSVDRYCTWKLTGNMAHFMHKDKKWPSITVHAEVDIEDREYLTMKSELHVEVQARLTHKSISLYIA